MKILPHIHLKDFQEPNEAIKFHLLSNFREKRYKPPTEDPQNPFEQYLVQYSYSGIVMNRTVTIPL